MSMKGVGGWYAAKGRERKTFTEGQFAHFLSASWV
jgi:hypothetical protein